MSHSFYDQVHAAVQEVKAGIHPSKTNQTLEKLELLKAKTKDIWKNACDTMRDLPDSSEALVIRRTAFIAFMQVSSAVDHLKGYDWGIFADAR